MRRRDPLMVGAAVVLLAWTVPLSAAGPLELGSLLGGTDVSGYAHADAVRPFQFPADHGPHPRFRSEWWYLTASLETDDGAAFGVQFTLFRQALRPRPVIGGPWDATQVYLAQLAVTDVEAGRHLQAQRLSRGHPQLAGVSVAPFRAHLDGWTLAASGPQLARLTLKAASRDFRVHLEMQPEAPIVLQGDHGLSRKGPGQASYYYSLPRLSAAGDVTVAGRRAAVHGTAWFDREWSTSVLREDQQGWDWFGLELDSGAELMVFQLRNKNGIRDPYDQGTWVDLDGVSHPLRTQDFSLEPLRWWTDSRGTRWPVRWRLSVMSPDGPRQFEVRAAVDDQRMDNLVTYWEGLVRVYDGTGAHAGTGYMELTGYE